MTTAEIGTTLKSTVATAPCQAVAPGAHDHRIQERAGDRLGRAHDDAQERHMIVSEDGPWCGNDVQADRVGKLHAARHGLREEVASGHDPLETMRLKERIDERFRRVKLPEEL